MTFVYMKILESAPKRYDRGIKLLTLGKLESVYDSVIENIKENQLVLDIGCGTGNLTIKAAKKGAKIKGIDINPQMLTIATEKAKKEKVTENIKWQEMSVIELDSEEAGKYDKVMSGLCFSELTENEQCFALKQVHRLLKDHGEFLIVDETRPKSMIKRIAYFLLMFPLKLITYIITQTTTKAVKELEKKLENEDFVIVETQKNFLGSMTYIRAKKKIT